MNIQNNTLPSDDERIDLILISNSSFLLSLLKRF